MLTGETPFKGDTYQLIFKHNKMLPPSLLGKRHDIPKPVAALVMKSLAKNPDERPITVEAFATALRLNVEGEIPMILQAISIYRKNLSIFLRISTLIYLPFMLISFLPLFYLSSLTLDATHSPFAHFLQKGCPLFAFLIISFANTIDIAACSLIIEKLGISPNSKFKFLQVLASLKQRLFPLVATTIRGNINILVGLLKLIRPGIKQYFDYSLYIPVLITEGIKGQSALIRSKILVDRSRSTAFCINVRNFFMAMMTAFIFLLMFIISSFLFDVLCDFLKQYNVFWGSTPTTLPVYIPILSFVVSSAFIILLHPIIAITTSIFYFKACQVGGEKLDEVLIKNFESGKEPVYKNLSYLRAVTLLGITVLVVVVWIFTKQEILFWAAAHDRVNTLKTMIYAGADVNARRSDGDTVLLVALGNNNNNPYGDSCFNVLLQAGADVNAKGRLDLTPLQLAIYNKQDSFITQLLQAGADVNAKGKRGTTALMISLWEQRGQSLATVKELLAAGADIDAKDDQGYTMLHSAFSSRGTYNTEIVKLLLSKGIDPNIKNKFGFTALMAAAHKGFTQAVQILVDAGADVNAKSNNGSTALSIAAEEGYDHIVQILKAAGAVESSKEEALIYAASTGNTSEVRQLITLGINPNIKDPYDSNTPLMCAIRHGHRETAQALIEMGADIEMSVEVNATRKGQETALIMAAFRWDADTVQMLISKGAKVNYLGHCTGVFRNADGDSILSIVFLGNYYTSKSKNPTETVKALLAAGINLRSKENAPVVSWAVKGGHTEAVKVLLAAGADVNAKDESGRTALTIAEDYGYINMIKLLKDAKAKH